MTALHELHRSPLGADGLTQSKKPLRRLSCWMIPERVTPCTGVCCNDGLRSSLQRTPPDGAANAMTFRSVSIFLGHKIYSSRGAVSSSTHQPFKVTMEPSQSVHVCPKYQRNRDHLEADVQQLGVAVVSPLYQKSCDEK